MADIVQMPTPLERLATSIKDDLAQMERGREAWVAGVILLCQHLAEARARFKADIAFGQWCDQSGFLLSHQDRAAAIAMGEHLDEVRPVLARTERRSLRLIHAEECRFTRTGKPRKGASGGPKPYRKAGLTGLHEALSGKYAVTWTSMNQRRGEAETLLGYAIPKTFTSPEALQRVAADYEAIVVPVLFPNAGTPPEPTPFAPSKQADYEAALRAARRKLEIEFEGKVQAAVKQRLDEMVLPHYAAKMAEADRVVKSRKGVMTKGQYRKLLACLHPDANKAEWAAEIFQVVKEAELVLLGEKDLVTSSGTLPRTLDELLRRRRNKL